MAGKRLVMGPSPGTGLFAHEPRPREKGGRYAREPPKENEKPLVEHEEEPFRMRVDAMRRWIVIGSGNQPIKLIKLSNYFNRRFTDDMSTRELGTKRFKSFVVHRCIRTPRRMLWRPRRQAGHPPVDDKTLAWVTEFLCENTCFMQGEEIHKHAPMS
eukprot:s655_g8.t1